jgi:hypothetical protein
MQTPVFKLFDPFPLRAVTTDFHDMEVMVKAIRFQDVDVHES